VYNTDMTWKHDTWLICDTETTGIPIGSKLTEIAFLVVQNMEVVSEFSTLLDPCIPIPEEVTKITGITNEMVAGKPIFADIADQLCELIAKSKTLIFYNADFDVGHIKYELTSVKLSLPEVSIVDPLIWVRNFDKFMKGKSLTNVAAKHSICIDGVAHRALADCKLLHGVVKHYLPKLPDELVSLLHLQDMWKRQQQADYSKWRSKQK